MGQMSFKEVQSVIRSAAVGFDDKVCDGKFIAEHETDLSKGAPQWSPAVAGDAVCVEERFVGADIQVPVEHGAAYTLPRSRSLDNGVNRSPSGPSLGNEPLPI